MSKLVSIGAAAKTLRVPTSTLRRWEAAGLLVPIRIQVEVVIINRGADTTFEEDLANDVLEIISVFPARLYGSRSHRNQKLIDGVRRAVREAQC